MIVPNRVQLIDTAVVAALGLGEIAPLQQGTGMVDRVDFEAQAFREPFLQVGFLRIDLAGHDAQGRPAARLLQAIDDRCRNVSHFS